MLKIRDQSTSGESLREFMLELLSERVTVREIIRSRVYQEVKDYNAGLGQMFQGLVRPDGAVHCGAGFRFSVPRRVDWEDQYRTAVRAFKDQRILVLIDESQATDLDDDVFLTTQSEVTFLKLLPLVGG